MSKYNFRRTYKRDQLRKQVMAEGLPCALCHRPIDYSLPAGDPWSFELDEKVPPSLLPPEMRKAAASDPGNVQPAHRICNQRKSNKVAGVNGKPVEIRRSRDWWAGG